MQKSTRRRAIGEDPLDALVGNVPAATRASRRGLAPAGTTPRPEPPARTRKVRVTFHVPEALVEELRDAVVALSGPPLRLTLAAVAETALADALERLKKDHNRGKDFPTREADLKGGRPIGT